MAKQAPATAKASWPTSDHMVSETHELFYAIHRHRGLYLGPRFRSVQYAWGREGSCYTVLNVQRPPKVLALRCEVGQDGEPVMCETSGYVYDLGLDQEDLSDDLLEYETHHPALLDGAFQSTFLSSSPVPGESPTALPIPFYIEAMTWRQQIDFDGFYGETCPVPGTEGRFQQFRIISTAGKQVIGVQNFEARILRTPSSGSQGMAAQAARVIDPLSDLHPVLQKAAYMSQMNGPETWGHLTSMKEVQEKGKAAPKRPKASAGSKQSIAIAKELLSKLSLEEALVEDMAVMDAGIKSSTQVAKSSTQQAAPASSSARAASSSSSGAWSKWASRQQAAQPEDEDEVIGVPDPGERQRRRAGTRRAANQQ